MPNYGRNFEFRVSPRHGQRAGRYATPSDGSDGNGLEFAIGAPVVGTGDFNTLELEEVEYAADGTAPVPGRNGILVFEHAPAAFAGDDPMLTTYSDKDTAPNGKAVQLVSGTEVKVVLRNTEDRTFLNTRDYAGKTMIAGLGATPTVAVGDYLEPHDTPSNTNGYWKETTTAADAWLVVTKVSAARNEVEARMLF